MTKFTYAVMVHLMLQIFAKIQILPALMFFLVSQKSNLLRNTAVYKHIFNFAELQTQVKDGVKCKKKFCHTSVIKRDIHRY